MNFTVGNSFLTTNINNKKIHELMTKNSIPQMSLWEKIKGYFFETGQNEALKCLYELFHPATNLTSNDVEGIFFKLKELASPIYKERFCSNHIDSSTTGKLHIKGDDSSDLLCIEQKGELCNYTILDKKFIFDIPLIESSAKESQFGTKNLSIHFRNRPHPQFNPNIKWMINEKACISYQGKNINLDYTNLYDRFMREVRSINKGDDFATWKKGERTTYLSAIINKQIDKNFTKLNIKTSSQDKDAIFNGAHKYINDGNLKLDTACAQPSIKQCIKTYINGESEINTLFEKNSEEKNEVVSEIVNKISDRIYEDIFVEDNGLIERLSSYVNDYYIRNTHLS
ncbi:hypothetical protein [Yersinia vastinensis]|uniref:hypothetical protein n=1 Tax=Yersinia vastinensis TaxID=2890318 RepID=UPI00384B0035